MSRVSLYRGQGRIRERSNPSAWLAVIGFAIVAVVCRVIVIIMEVVKYAR